MEDTEDTRRIVEYWEAEIDTQERAESAERSISREKDAGRQSKT